jgi:dTDP-4-dehydrorhamnose reductase
MKAVVLGGGGLLGRHLADELSADWEVRAYPRRDCDVTDLAKVTEVCAGADVIFCCAAFTNVDGAESDPTGAWRGNALGSENVARAGLAHGAKVVVISTDFVFDGAQRTPYDELAVPNPLGVYGRSKLMGERLAERVGGKLFVVRVQGLYGKGGGNFSSKLAELIKAGAPLKLDAERRVQPTWARSAARGLAKLVRIEHYGLYHMSCRGETTWAGFSRRVAERLGVKPAWREVQTGELKAPAARPAYCLFAHEMLALRGIPLLPEWSEAFDEYLKEVGV